MHINNTHKSSEAPEALRATMTTGCHIQNPRHPAEIVIIYKCTYKVLYSFLLPVQLYCRFLAHHCMIISVIFVKCDLRNKHFWSCPPLIQPKESFWFRIGYICTRLKSVMFWVSQPFKCIDISTIMVRFYYCSHQFDNFFLMPSQVGAQILRPRVTHLRIPLMITIQLCYNHQNKHCK